MAKIKPDFDLREIDDELAARRRNIRKSAGLLLGRLRIRFLEAFTVRNVINIVFIATVCVVCLQQCYIQIKEYLQFSTKVQVSHVFPTSTLWLVPGVTICNNNRLRLSKLMGISSKLEKRMIDLLNGTKMNQLKERKRVEVMRSIKTYVDETLNVNQVLEASSIPKLIEISSKPMIKDVDCNGLWGKQFNCENIRIIESYQSSPCYTLFYLGSLLESLANGLAYDFETRLLGGQRKLSSFSNHEVAEIMVDFNPMDHADYHRDIGGKVVIHSTAHIGSVRDMAHSIIPGYKYDLVLQRSMSKRLPPPYKSMCFDYKKANSHKFMTGEPASPDTELDKTACTRNCIVRQTTKLCNCWPVEIPYFEGSNLIENAGTYRLCSWAFDEQRGNYSAYLYVDCYKQFHAKCRTLCKQGCRTEDYKVDVMSSPWPSRDMFYRAANETERLELHRLSSCCAKISIKYVEFMENRHIMYPSMTLAQLVSNIGGIVSALVGVSGVTIYRYITRKVLRLRVVGDYQAGRSA